LAKTENTLKKSRARFCCLQRSHLIHPTTSPRTCVT